MIRLVRTCFACPEQYDAFDGDEEVGYLRLRHGCFTVERGSRTIVSTRPRGDGLFDSDERDLYLRLAVTAIQLDRGLLDVEYVVVDDERM